MDTIQRLTEKIDSYAHINWGTGADVRNNLWSDLSDLRNFKENRRANMLMDWKYKADFEYAEHTHLNGQQVFQRLTWEESYVVALLFAHYH
jgi:hypothetical protein